MRRFVSPRGCWAMPASAICLLGFAVALSCKPSEPKRDLAVAPVAPDTAAAPHPPTVHVPAPPPDVPKLIEQLSALSHCEKDVDCTDLGYVCGMGCHVGVAAHRGEQDDSAALLRAKIRGAVPCDTDGESRKCGLFFGMTCDQGRCVARSKPPALDICWAYLTPPRAAACITHPTAAECHPRTAAVECRVALRDLGGFFPCLDFCRWEEPGWPAIRGLPR